MRSKITTEHDSDCAAVAAVERGDWDTPWCLPRTPRFFYADSLFRRHQGMKCWIELVCNDCRCEGTAVVLETDIAMLGPRP